MLNNDVLSIPTWLLLDGQTKAANSGDGRGRGWGGVEESVHNVWCRREISGLLRVRTPWEKCLLCIWCNCSSDRQSQRRNPRLTAPATLISAAAKFAASISATSLSPLGAKAWYNYSLTWYNYILHPHRQCVTWAAVGLNAFMIVRRCQICNYPNFYSMHVWEDGIDFQT